MREESADEGHLLEVFGSSTAATVSPVRFSPYKAKWIDCGAPATLSEKRTQPVQ